MRRSSARSSAGLPSTTRSSTGCATPSARATPTGGASTRLPRLCAEYDRLQNRIHAAYVDKLDGSIDADFFEKMSPEWRAKQDRCLRDIERHQSTDQSYLEDGVRLFELAQSAQRLFAKQDAREKRRLLSFVVSNCY